MQTSDALFKSRVLLREGRWSGEGGTTCTDKEAACSGKSCRRPACEGSCCRGDDSDDHYSVNLYFLKRFTRAVAMLTLFLLPFLAQTGETNEGQHIPEAPCHTSATEAN